MADNRLGISKTICDNAFKYIKFTHFPINRNNDELYKEKFNNIIKKNNINDSRLIDTLKRCSGICNDYYSHEDCKNKKMVKFSFANYADSENWALNFFKCMTLYTLYEDPFVDNEIVSFSDVNEQNIKLLKQSEFKYKKYLIKNKLFIDSVVDHLFEKNIINFRYNEDNDTNNQKKNQLKSLIKSIYERFIFIDEESIQISFNYNGGNNNARNKFNEEDIKKINVRFKYQIKGFQSNRSSYLSAIKKVFGFRRDNPCILALFFDDISFRYNFENIMKFDTKSYINKTLKELYTNSHPDSSETNKKIFEEIQHEIDEYVDVAKDIEQIIIRDINTKEGNRPFNFTSNNQRKKFQKNYNIVEKKISDKLKNYYMCYNQKLNEYESEVNDLLIPNFAYEYFEDLVKKKIYKKQKKKNLDKNMSELFSIINPRFIYSLPHMMIYYPSFFTKKNCEKYANYYYEYRDLDLLHKDVFSQLMTEDYKTIGSIIKHNKEKVDFEYSKINPQSGGTKKKRKKQKLKNNSKKKRKLKKNKK